MCKVNFEKFEKQRIDLLTKLENSEIDKAEFLDAMYEVFRGKLFAEPDNIKSIDEGIYYYCYFNTLAKKYMGKSKSFDSKKNSLISNEYYEIKENILYKLIQKIENKDFIAYYVNTDSVKLKKRLVEIVLPNYNRVIFHSIEAKTISYLKRRGVLSDEIRDSIISSYINKKYY